MNTDHAQSAASRQQRWQGFLQALPRFAQTPQPLEQRGKLVRITGLVLEAVGVRAAMGTLCEIHAPGRPAATAEVVGFHGDRTYLMPTAHLHGLAPGAWVLPQRRRALPPRFGVASHPWRRVEDQGLHLPMGQGLLGRVIDPLGHPLDHLGELQDTHEEPMHRRPINAMEREPIRQPLDTGVRAINGLLSVGRGQRIGLFAGTGVGKSVLLGMMARYTQADVIVVGLVGERGREVKEFIEDILGAEGLQRSVVVAAPADAPPLLRLQGAHYATAIAEHFRDQNQHVLLLMDSLTRYAMAQREIALAIGEPPATKGYPPSCFAKLPQLVERSGNGLKGQGSITAFYTVLSEGDDQQDPIADAARGILDGHIVLSRELAEAGHFPAIDIERSISRVMVQVTTAEQQLAARRIRRQMAQLSRARDLIQVGAYVQGSDPELDAAIGNDGAIRDYLQQGMHERASLVQSQQRLQQLATPR
ncbi:MAG: flagellar protein export ATPase FliI [Rubrivivax sp.]